MLSGEYPSLSLPSSANNHVINVDIDGGTAEKDCIASSSRRPISPWYSHPDIERDRSLVVRQCNNLSDIFKRRRMEKEEDKRRQRNPDDGDGDDAIADSTSGYKFVLISSGGI